MAVSYCQMDNVNDTNEDKMISFCKMSVLQWGERKFQNESAIFRWMDKFYSTKILEKWSLD